jgi:hypothetical protein
MVPTYLNNSDGRGIRIKTDFFFIIVGPLNASILLPSNKVLQQLKIKTKMFNNHYIIIII